MCVFSRLAYDTDSRSEVYDTSGMLCGVHSESPVQFDSIHS